MKKIVICTLVMVLVFGAASLAGDVLSIPITAEMGPFAESANMIILGAVLIGLARFGRKRLSKKK